MRLRGKRVIDALMTVWLLFLMGYQFWGEAAHEWAGIEISLLFLLHHILNIRWYPTVIRGRYTKLRILQTVLDFLLLLDVLVLMYSGIAMSHHVFNALPNMGGMALARRLHLVGSYWGVLLISLHLGLHWNLVLSAMQKRNSQISWKVLSGIGMVVAAYGLWVFLKRDFPTCLFLQSEFVFLDYEESPLLFYLDYLALMGLCIFVAHIVGKILKKADREKV